MRWRLLALSPVVMLASCAHGPTGTFGPDYFKHNQTGYELIYVGEGPTNSLGKSWQLDNYEQLPARGGGQEWFPKRGESYAFSRGYDLTGDHVPDVHETQPIYDLRFVQRGGEGAVWLRSVDMAAPLEAKPLSVLARRYVSKVPRTGPIFEHFGEALPSSVAWEGFEVAQLDEQACEVANVEAFRIDFRVREKGADTNWQRMALVLMRPGYSHQVESSAGQRARFETLLAAAYLNREEAFEAGLSGFDALLDQLSLAKGQRPHTCRATTSAQPDLDATVQPAAEAARELESATSGGEDVEVPGEGAEAP